MVSYISNAYGDSSFLFSFLQGNYRGFDIYVWKYADLPEKVGKVLEEKLEAAKIAL